MLGSKKTAGIPNGHPRETQAALESFNSAIMEKQQSTPCFWICFWIPKNKARFLGVRRELSSPRGEKLSRPGQKKLRHFIFIFNF